MRRTIYTEDHQSFRETIRSFIEKEVTPVYDEWYEAGIVPHDFYLKLGELGVWGIQVPEEYGGAGIESFKYSAVMTEELVPRRCLLRRLVRPRRAVPALPPQPRHQGADGALDARLRLR